jgi:hypothetical protein
MKKVLFILIFALFGCTPSEIDKLKSDYEFAKKHKDLIKLTETLSALNKHDKARWGKEYTHAVRAKESVTSASEALSSGQLVDAIHYSQHSFAIFKSQQVINIIKKVSKDTAVLNKLQNAWHVLAGKKEQLNIKITTFYTTAPLTWNVVDFNRLLIELIKQRKVFAREKIKIERETNKSALFTQVLNQVIVQLAELDLCINTLLAKVIVSVSDDMVTFTDKVSEQTILNLNHFSDENVPGMMASYYSQFMAAHQEDHELIQNAQLVVYKHNFEAFTDVINFYQAYWYLLHPPKTYENYEGDVRLNQRVIAVDAKRANAYINKKPDIEIHDSLLLTTLSEKVKSFKNQ